MRRGRSAEHHINRALGTTPQDGRSLCITFYKSDASKGILPARKLVGLIIDQHTSSGIDA